MEHFLTVLLPLLAGSKSRAVSVLCVLTLERRVLRDPSNFFFSLNILSDGIILNSHDYCEFDVQGLNFRSWYVV